MMTMKRKWSMAPAIAGALLCAAVAATVGCGDDDDGGDPIIPDPPAGLSPLTGRWTGTGSGAGVTGDLVVDFVQTGQDFTSTFTATAATRRTT